MQRPYGRVRQLHGCGYVRTDTVFGRAAFCFSTAESPVKPIIDLVACADCIDAATDGVGRSYSHGKTLDEVLHELEAGAGTRYAPWMVELLSLDCVRAELAGLLHEGRKTIYENTYLLLRDVIARG